MLVGKLYPVAYFNTLQYLSEGLYWLGEKTLVGKVIQFW